MSADNNPFRFDDALEDALRNDPVPTLSVGFADRVVAATEGRADPLPKTRPSPAKRWRSGRRLVIGAVAAGALASAAAATGLLEDLPIDLPSPEQVWSAITGQQSAPEPSVAPSEPQVPPDQPFVPEGDAPVAIEGAIDTPEELEEAFRRVDEARSLRRDNRRDAVDRRIDNAIDRRRENGLRAPTPEQEERLRGRIERFRERSDERREGLIEERREGLREEIENGGELSREEFINRQRGSDGQGSDTPIADRLERLRDLPPEERRARIREWRERREERRQERLQRRGGRQVDPSGQDTADPSDTVSIPNGDQGEDAGSRDSPGIDLL